MRVCRLRRAAASAAAAAAAAGALLAAALLWRAARPSLAARLHARAAPHEVAAALADFSNHPMLYPAIQSWSIKEESSNLTSWRYGVRFECGQRCVGAASVQHVARRPTAARRDTHGPADTHELYFSHSYCTSLPLLFWPKFCDVINTEVEVKSGEEGGSVVRVAAGGGCWGRGAGACAALPALPAALRAKLDVLAA